MPIWHCPVCDISNDKPRLGNTMQRIPFLACYSTSHPHDMPTSVGYFEWPTLGWPIPCIESHTRFISHMALPSMGRHSMSHPHDIAHQRGILRMTVPMLANTKQSLNGEPHACQYYAGQYPSVEWLVHDSQYRYNVLNNTAHQIHRTTKLLQATTRCKKVSINDTAKT